MTRSRNMGMIGAVVVGESPMVCIGLVQPADDVGVHPHCETAPCYTWVEKGHIGLSTNGF